MELETFKITVLPLREKLINISWRMMEDRSDAEDIVQETFLKLWQIREKLDGYNSVEALAVQVAKNHVAMYPGITKMLDKLAKTNVIHKNKANNLKSKLALYINKLA